MKLRLLSAHFFPGDKWLPGDKELSHLGEARGTVVGDGTDYPVTQVTLEMTALDEEAEAALVAEQERLDRNAASMRPLEQLPLQGGMDTYEERYTPGFERKGRKAA